MRSRTGLYLLLLGVSAAALVWVWPKRTATPPSPSHHASPTPTATPSHRRTSQSSVVWPRTSEAETLRLSGRIIDQLTSAGVSDAHIQLRGRAEYRLRSNNDGRFSIEVTPGHYRLVVQQANYATMRGRLAVGGPNAISGLRLALSAKSNVAGQVFDGLGRPLAGAMITSSAEDASERSADSITSDANGRFSLAVAPGLRTLQAQSQRHGVALSETLRVPVGLSVDGIALRFGSALTLGVRVIGPAGQQISRATVWLEGPLGQRSQRTDEQGLLAWRGLPAGYKRLQATASGFGPSRVQALRLAKGGANRVTLRLTTAHPLAGTVLTSEQAIASGALVKPIDLSKSFELSPPAAAALFALPSVRTDNGGRFRFNGLGDLPIALRASAGKMLAIRSGLIGPKEDLTLTLLSPGKLSLEVSDGSRGRPLTVFRVMIASSTMQQVWQVASSTGSFSRSLAQGAYRVTLDAPGFAARQLTDVSITANVLSHRAVALDAAARLIGAVVDAEGQPIAGASVALPTAIAEPTVLTDWRGEFRLTRAARGRHQLDASHPAYRPVQQFVSLFVDRVNRVTLKLPRNSATPPVQGDPGLSLAAYRGALHVTQVRPNSPAAIAGIDPGDKLTEIAQQPVTAADLSVAKAALIGPLDRPLALTLERGDSRRSLYLWRVPRR
ncbi:MAG: carboxypeptidase regulatory-like domain-containing protein [Deltaproteobacteria bacterium]|nr:carboxypeptidase regulatory-like domain-containing protein [Deltaproteobacteria bacterium]